MVEETDGLRNAGFGGDVVQSPLRFLKSAQSNPNFTRISINSIRIPVVSTVSRVISCGEWITPNTLSRTKNIAAPIKPQPIISNAEVALSKNIVIYHRGERRVRRVFRRFHSLFRFSGAFAFSVCSAVNFKDLKYNFYLFRTQIYADLRRKLFPQIIKSFNFLFSAKIKFKILIIRVHLRPIIKNYSFLSFVGVLINGKKIKIESLLYSIS